MRGRVLRSLLLAAVALGAGCHYAPVDPYRSDIRTVYVQFFDNTTFRRGLEVDLTRAVVEEVQAHTTLLLAPRDKADSILSGELVDFSEHVRVKDVENDILLTRVHATVVFRWRDRLTGRLIVPERTVREPALVAEALDDSLYDLVFRKAAQTIVEQMQQNW